MAKTFFTSDLHFHHTGIIKFCPTFRPHNTAPFVDEMLIEYWNATVSPEDVVYNLGDLSFTHNIKQIEKILSRLNGTHHLIYGNHDDLVQQNIAHLLKTPKHDGLPMLASAQSYAKIKLETINKTLILFHYPVQEWEGCHKGWYHLHGHIHDRIAPVKGRVLNVGWDLHGRFLTEHDVDEFLRDLPIVSYFGDDDFVLEQDVTANQYLLKNQMDIINQS